MKVAVNTCYGGFGLSPDAQKALAKKRGVEVFIFKENSIMTWTLIKLPPTDVVADKEKLANWITKYYYRVKTDVRHDPDLIAVIEEFGKAADSEFAEIDIQEVKGDRYIIEEYDGTEALVEPDEINWVVPEGESK